MLYGMYAIARTEELRAEAQKEMLVAQLRVSGDGQPSARRQLRNIARLAGKAGTLFRSGVIVAKEIPLKGERLGRQGVR
jgi:hypothetical protein